MPTYDWFSKFTRCWAAAFACQIVLPMVIGYLAYVIAWSPAAFKFGSMLVLAVELLVIPSAIFTAIIAALCIALTVRLKTAVIASALIALAVPILMFAPAVFFQSV